MVRWDPRGEGSVTGRRERVEVTSRTVRKWLARFSYDGKLAPIAAALPRSGRHHGWRKAQWRDGWKASGR